MDVSSIRSKNTIILSNSIKYITKTIIRVKKFSFLAIILHPYNIISVKKEKKITTFDLPAGVVSENKWIPLFSVNFRFTQQQESSTIFTRTYTRLVIPVRGSNLLENDRIGWWRGEKISLQAHFAKENTGAANSAKRFASGTTIERMKGPIINSITRARSGPGTGQTEKSPVQLFLITDLYRAWSRPTRVIARVARNERFHASHWFIYRRTWARHAVYRREIIHLTSRRGRFLANLNISRRTSLFCSNDKRLRGKEVGFEEF